MDLELQGVHVLVTGSSGGIGLETACLFLDHGAKVSAHYNTNLQPLKQLIDKYGPSCIRPVQANLGVEEEVHRAFESFDEKNGGFGPVQVAIVNHAYYPPADVPVSHMSLEQWNSTLNANLTSSFLVLRQFMRGLEGAAERLKNKAAVVLIGSTAGKFGEAGHMDYAVTKSAMMYAMTSTLKNEIVKIAPKGRVNCVAPGWVKTPMAAEALSDPEIVYRALATTPMKKVATPREIATQVITLASPSVSSHVSGEVMMITGGMEGRLLNKREDI